MALTSVLDVIHFVLWVLISLNNDICRHKRLLIFQGCRKRKTFNIWPLNFVTMICITDRKLHQLMAWWKAFHISQGCFQLGRPLQIRLILNERVAICARVLFALNFNSQESQYYGYEKNIDWTLCVPHQSFNYNWLGLGKRGRHTIWNK